ncbi:MAG: YbaK/EbsC family protein [Pseudomonadota bacterium]
MSKSKKLGGLERFRQWQDTQGHTFEVVMLDEAANTAKLAADALGCNVAQIAKSLIFRCVQTDSALLVITSGANRVDEAVVARHVGEELARVDAAFVREQTGYAIGGVPPFAHKGKMRSLVDETLMQFEHIWAAAGHPKSIFCIAPQKLLDICAGERITVS